MSFADFARRFAERQRGNTPRPAPALPIIQSPFTAAPGGLLPSPTPADLNATAAAHGLPLPFPQVPSTYTSAPTIPLRRLQPRTAVAP